MGMPTKYVAFYQLHLALWRKPCLWTNEHLNERRSIVSCSLDNSTMPYIHWWELSSPETSSLCMQSTRPVILASWILNMITNINYWSSGVNTQSFEAVSNSASVDFQPNDLGSIFVTVFSFLKMDLITQTSKGCCKSLINKCVYLYIY